MNSNRLPITIRETRDFLSQRYELSKSDSISAIYALLEVGAIVEEAKGRFLDTPIQWQASLAELDYFVGQLYEHSAKISLPPPPKQLLSSESAYRLVATLPPLKANLSLPQVDRMHDAFEKIIRTAKETLRISSPYIELGGLNQLLDSFELAAAKGVKLRLLIRLDKRPNKTDIGQIKAILKLYDMFKKKLTVRSFAKSLKGKWPYKWGGVHAKLLIADYSIAYLGSGELRDHALSRNFEIGIVTDELDTISTLARLFDAVWDESEQVTREYCHSFVE